MDAQTILVVILGVILAIFLILAIVLTVMLIKISRRVSGLTDRAESVTNNLVSISGVMKKSLHPAVVAGILSKVVKKIVHKTDNKRRKHG